MAPVHTRPDPGEADLAQAFQEIARGEQAASAMENQLTALEQKIDALLAGAQSPGAPDENRHNNNNNGNQEKDDRNKSTDKK
ncbi:MAG: hypothetical protein Q9186_005817 [Xanthomendoza sp. 1 TL-2023]